MVAASGSRYPARCPARACRSCSPRAGAFPPPSPPPARASFVRRLHQYYAPVRLLAPVHRRRALLRASRRGPEPPWRLRADARSPRFRRVPFVRDGVSDLGRASAPRMTAPHMLPSTGSEGLGLCNLNISRLDRPTHMIAVYASPPPSPVQTQHSLPGGPLRPYPRGTLTRWNAPASPGAPDPNFFMSTTMSSPAATRIA